MAAKGVQAGAQGALLPEPRQCSSLEARILFSSLARHWRSCWIARSSRSVSATKGTRFTKDIFVGLVPFAARYSLQLVSGLRAAAREPAPPGEGTTPRYCQASDPTQIHPRRGAGLFRRKHAPC